MKEGFEVKTASSKNNPFLRLLDMLWAVVTFRKPDYVLIDTYSTTGFWYAFLVSQLCRLTGKPYIPILHGGNLPNRLRSNPKFCAMIFKNAYKNVAPSNYLLTAFQEFGLDNVVFIPNNIEIIKYPFKYREHLKPKLLWVRAFAAIYNPKMAIDVLDRIKKIYPDAELCMVGPDKDGTMQSCKKYALEKGCNVHFTGRLAKEEWIELAKEYDIFINTTHFDNTPVSLMEAMALGLPIVTTNVGGIPYLLSDKKEAVLVGDNDSDAMEKSIIHLIEKPEVAQTLIRNARLKAEQWDWETVKLHWNAILR